MAGEDEARHSPQDDGGYPHEAPFCDGRQPLLYKRPPGHPLHSPAAARYTCGMTARKPMGRRVRREAGELGGEIGT